jgi:hypothetical protein
MALVLAATGWLKRRRWGWQLAVAITGTQVLGDFINIFFGRAAQGLVGVAIAGAPSLHHSAIRARRSCSQTETDCPRGQPMRPSPNPRRFLHS